MTYLLAQASAHRIPLRDESVQTCVTSPPYWGLRAYAGEQSFVWGGEDHEHEWASELRRTAKSGGASAKQESSKGAWNPQGIAAPSDSCLCGAWRGALGLEPTPDLFVAHMVEVFREVRRVLRKDGTLWLNLGDSYAGSTMGGGPASSSTLVGTHHTERPGARFSGTPRGLAGLKPKDLVGIPWRVAFALQADGWYLRSDIIWAKPNPMPESVTDRPTKSHEYVFLLSKSERYFYDADAIREEAIHDDTLVSGRNARSVWNIATQPYPGAHFATFPEELPERCIKAGSAAQACSVCGAPWQRVTDVDYEELGAISETDKARDPMQGNNRATRAYGRARKLVDTLGFEPTCEHAAPTVGSVVLDPFNGSGTTGRVAMRLGRRYVGLDLSREYLVEQAVARIDPIAAAARDFRERKDGAQGALL